MNIKPIFFLLIIAIFISCNSKNTHSEDVTAETDEVTKFDYLENETTSGESIENIDEENH